MTVELMHQQPAPRQDIVPGRMHCSVCGFNLTRVNLYVYSGTTGAGGSETEPCPNDGNPLLPVTWEQEAREGWKANEVMFDRAIAAEKDRDRLDALVNSPETHDFLVGVRNEVAHQVERWGTVHDRAKEPGDWFWLVGYLANKALVAHVKGDTDKALHHCISTAAVLANWHTHIAHGAGLMQPGSSDLQQFLRETFGANFLEAAEARG